MITVYGFSRVTSFAHGRTRDLRVLWALEEMGLPYRVEGMDHPAHALNTEAYRELNPFEQIPVIDDEGIVLSESGAILLYLAQKYDKLIPQDERGRAQVMRWCFAALSSVELPMIFLDVLDIAAKKAPDAKPQRELVMQTARRYLAGVERWLEGREFVAADTFTVADILMAQVLSQKNVPGLFDDYPVVRAYRERCKSRPAWKRTIDAYCDRVAAS